ncbi:MAG: SusD/RagB family nutrient-binding outer membrane lipoprotein [Salinibacter sp.]
MTDLYKSLFSGSGMPALVAAALLLTACTDNFSAMNTPESELAASELGANNIGQMFAQTQWDGMFGGRGNFQTAQGTFANLYSQIEAEQAGSFDTGQYAMNSGWLDGTWNTFYGKVAPQVQFVREFTAENDMPVRNAVINVWRVYLYHRITDYWGPIIYSDFGTDDPTVSYDSQESIYRDFFKKLGQAASVLRDNPDGNAFGSNDLIYEGDARKWFKFANTLQLRLAMRVKYAAPDLAKAEAEEAVDRGVMMDNSDNAMVLTTQDNRNPLQTYHDWNEHRMSAAMESLLEGYKDPRLGTYWSTVGADKTKHSVQVGDKDGDGSAYEGMRKGVPRTNKGDRIEAKYSARGRRWWRPSLGGTNPPLPVMRAAEAYFLRAEGALEGWSMGGTAEELYNQGIRTSLREDRFDVSEQEIDAYINRESRPVAPGDSAKHICCEFAKTPIYPDTPALTDIPVDFQRGADKETKLEQIITQKWLALHNDGWELWAELRRTGYPKRYPIIESLSPVLDEDDLPQRVPFVRSEYSNNTEPVNNAAEMLNGPDNPATELWWDQKSGSDDNVTYPSSQ